MEILQYFAVMEILQYFAVMETLKYLAVIPAQAGTQRLLRGSGYQRRWAPACAGATKYEAPGRRSTRRRGGECV